MFLHITRLLELSTGAILTRRKEEEKEDMKRSSTKCAKCQNHTELLTSGFVFAIKSIVIGIIRLCQNVFSTHY